jgi:hypothetical protein
VASRLLDLCKPGRADVVTDRGVGRAAEKSGKLPNMDAVVLGLSLKLRTVMSAIMRRGDR